MTRAFWWYPICRGPLNQSGLGSGQVTTWARAKLQLAVHELQYVLQCIVINKTIDSKKLILVFLLHFSVALAQNTTGVTTTTIMAARGQKCPPSAPHEALRSTPTPWMDGWQPPPSMRMYFGGGWGCVLPSKCSFVPAMMHHHNIRVCLGP